MVCIMGREGSVRETGAGLLGREWPGYRPVARATFCVMAAVKVRTRVGKVEVGVRLMRS